MTARTGRYFPEIVDEQSSYLSVSPLTEIIQELRRKNVVTAAATSGPQMSLLVDSSSDPWGSSEDGPVVSSCMCQTTSSRRAYGSRQASSFGYSSPPQRSANARLALNNRDSVGSELSREEGVCPACGRARGDTIC